MLIKSINWIITDGCNLRCKHCDIWQLPAKAIDNTLVEKLLKDPVVKESYKHYGKTFDISLGGGEPFAHPKLQEIVARIEKLYPHSLKTISTNGVLTKKIFHFLKNNPELNFKLNISLDGLKDTHDKIRGLKGSFDKTIQTIRIIKHSFPDQKIEIKLTIMHDNFSEIKEIYSLSKNLGCSFSCKPLDHMENYTNRKSVGLTSFKENEICSIRNQTFFIADKMLLNHEYKKARFTKDIPFHLSGKKKHCSCSVLWEHLTVLVNGDIFYCIKEEKAGNIYKNFLNQMKTKPKSFQCKSCMLMCGAFKDYSDTPYKETVANVEATLECNLACTMCTQKDLQGLGLEMSLNDFSKLIKNNHLDHVSFVGGESFLNNRIFLMMDLLDAKGISYEMTTNGTLFTLQNRKELKKCIGLKKINFSIDGLEEYHDRVRGKGVFKKAVKALIFSKHFFNVSVASIIKSDNLSILPDLRKYLIACSIFSQKFIYAMNFSDTRIQDSLKKISTLKIQGPKCNDQVKNAEDLHSLFEIFEKMSFSISYEPCIMRTHTKEFLGEQPIGNCKQLEQFRFDPMGKRIICEFIRNTHNSKLNTNIQKAHLPICNHCCKLDFDKSYKTT